MEFPLIEPRSGTRVRFPHHEHESDGYGEIPNQENGNFFKGPAKADVRDRHSRVAGILSAASKVIFGLMSITASGSTVNR